MYIYENIVFVILLFFFGVFGNVIVLFVLICFVKIYKWCLFYRLVFGFVILDGGGILVFYLFVEY